MMTACSAHINRLVMPSV